MVDWQVTATTVRCDAVDEEVTLLVYKDWSVKCTGYAKYATNDRKGGRNGRRDRVCEGTDCRVVTQYIEKLRLEEAKS